ncbi:MAG: HDOD domain-containing protein [Fimbriimonadaceae bacterium]|nr:HDOD domain-containing protein [Fimbriimonadaceae bacterium]
MSIPAGKLSCKQYVDKALRDLPPLPAVVTRLLDMTGKDDTTSTEVEDVIGADQAISAKLLRVVNSSYFGLPRQVSSISQAVVILGFQQVRNLVLSVSALGIFSARTPRAREIQRECWEHALTAASGAQMIAREKRLDAKDQETVFLGGLLHDVGKLFLFSTFTSNYQLILTESERLHKNIVELERPVFGSDHAEIGQRLAVAWNFPDQLVMLIGRHEGEFAGDPTPMLYCVHAADRLANSVMAGDKDWPDGTIDPTVLAWLGFSDDDFARIRSAIEIKLAESSEAIGMLS